MKTILKYTTAVVLAGAMALAVASPSQARHGRNAAAIGGFVAGAVIGSAVASSNNGYYGEPDYAYDPGYAYEGYAYEPGPTYVAPPQYYSRRRSNDFGGPNCNARPGSPGFGASC
ncbi:MAG TPA: hypothetical protein VFC54_13690 [Pseudolabrys sp.]|nr:hypothetical protein [Pseudolabrys sp.]